MPISLDGTGIKIDETIINTDGIITSKMIDFESVRHGRWLKNGDRYCECSVCHHEGNTSGADNYCWYCGAKMDVETGNTYSIGKIELPTGVFRQIYDEERKEDETD